MSLAYILFSLFIVPPVFIGIHLAWLLLAAHLLKTDDLSNFQPAPPFDPSDGYGNSLS